MITSENIAKTPKERESEGRKLNNDHAFDDLKKLYDARRLLRQYN